MEKINVMVLYGGCSNEHEVSKSSAITVISNIPADKYNTIPVYITPQGKWLLYDGYVDNIRHIKWDKFGTPVALNPDRTQKSLLRIVGNKVKAIPIDIAFPVLHGKNGEDGTIQGLFELAGLPYVGSGVLSSAICMDKSFCKQTVGLLGIPQADYIVFDRNDLADLDSVTKAVRFQIGYPCFIKPASGGSSIGISKATNKKTLEKALLAAAEHDRKVIAEKAVAGRELECSVLGSGGDDTEASAVGEILPGADFYDYDDKYNNNTAKTIAPADIPEHISEEIRQSAVKIFKALDGHGLARVDFFLQEDGQNVVFNEINTMPGFTNISMYPKLWEVSGVNLPALLDRLITLGLNRYE